MTVDRGRKLSELKDNELPSVRPIKGESIMKKKKAQKIFKLAMDYGRAEYSVAVADQRGDTWAWREALNESIKLETKLREELNIYD
jgi:hypothetical protein